MSTPYGNDPYGQQQPQNPYGGGGGGSSFNAPGSGGFEQPKTDGVSIAALVTGLICCAPVSLILGFVGLGRTKGGQRKGRGMAITGIILGLLGLLVWVGVGIAGVAGVNFLDSIVTPENAEVGQCVNVDEEGDEVFLREAECSEEHDAEIVAVAEVTDENIEQVESLMVGYCAEAISEDDRAKLTDYLGDLQAVTEDPNDVSVGDHLVCYVEPDDKLDEPIL
ncbi:DUF4190 domain-containing protein [Nocardioides antri]|uniref:DUF4190 domain-containing protein n=1 Tax=Nocardioides antri TaxID=2607659 RepID=UPI00165ECDCF|nr:DUF4190 domain-containing protein [Nocardioides antri]